MPDAITLDWMLRCATLLKALPIDLMLRPHPEGVFAGKRHPLNRVAPVPKENFEQLLGRADTVVLDASLSRVFCISLISDKSVVLLDPGYRHVFPSLQQGLEARCSIVPIAYDERGLPQVDKDELAEAVLHPRRPDIEVVRKFRSVFGEM